MKPTLALFAALVALTVPAVSGCAGVTSDDSETEATSQDLAASTWVKLGDRHVQGHVDRDVIPVGFDDARFNAIQLRVEGSPIVMFDVKVVFGDGETFEPNVRLVFDADTRTRAIDLPGNNRFIRRVEFRYGNVEPGTFPDAQVELYGRNVNWRELGELQVDGRHDHDSLPVGVVEGLYSALQIRVEDSSLLMHDIKVVFANGEVFEPRVRLHFEENSRSRVIDLPGNVRFIRRVDFRYSDIPGGGHARVAVWATR